MRNPIVAVPLLVIAGLLAGDEAPAPIVIRWFAPGADELPVVECRIPRSRFAAVGDPADLVVDGRLHLVRDEPGEAVSLPVLYPVVLGREPDRPDDLRVLFRSGRGIAAPERACVTVSGARSYLPAKSRIHRFNRRHASDWIAPVAPLAGDAGAGLLAEWRRCFAAELTRRIAEREDHELELLLDWRFFGYRRASLAPNWKRSAILKLFFAISGLADIEDALPRNREALLDPGERTLPPPEGVSLPEVETREVGDFTASPLADWTPRDCWYLEFPSLAGGLDTLDAAAALVDGWSGRTWRRSGAGVIAAHREALGLTDAWVEANGARVTGMALAGRDPYFQSGTHLLLVLGSEGPLEPPPGVAARQLPGGPLLLATAPALLDAAVACREDGSNLRTSPQFRDARSRVLPVESERELGFLYLGDHCITAFLSPRWYLTNQRLNQVDARIRLAELLRLVAAAELGRKVSLAELPGAGLLPEAEAAWLLADLVEDEAGAVVHATLGGIGAHPPVEDIPFDLVTPAEKAAYEDFARRYRGLWRRMDPVGFSLCDAGDGRFRTRLFVSPISRNSWVRMIMPFVNAEKRPQRLLQVPGLALGACLRLDLKELALPAELPGEKDVSLQLLVEDFASTSYAPETWLQDERPQDPLSWYRAPAALVAPRTWTNSLFRLLFKDQTRTALERDIEVLPLNWFDAASPLLVLDQPERADVALAVNPGVLRRLRDVPLQEAFDPVPSDLHLWLDLEAGYTLRRKLWFLAVQDRTWAGWRRVDRLRRISEALGRADDDPVLAALGDRGVFPVEVPPLALALDRLPRRPGERSRRRSYGSSVLNDLTAFPPLFRDLLRADLYLVVEPEAIYSEGWFLRRVAAETP